MNTKLNFDTLSDEDFALQIVQDTQGLLPDAQFTHDLEQRLIAADRAPQRPHTFFRLMRVLGTLAAALVLMIILTVNVPALRAIAQEIVNFFTRSSSDQTTMAINSYPPAETQFFTSVQDAEGALSRDFVEPQMLPSIRNANEDIQVRVETVSQNDGGLLIEYQPITILLDASGQKKGERTQPFKSLFIWFGQVPREIAEANDAMLVGESAQIEAVSFQFKGQTVSGQLVHGIWQGGVISQEDLDAAKNGENVEHEAVWVDDGTLQLMWQDETTFYSLQFFSQTVMTLTRDDIIDMAESIE